MNYPTARRYLWGSDQQYTVCPTNCALNAGCGTTHPGRRHWWGQHSASCPDCKDIVEWRCVNGIMNCADNSGVGPDGTYPIRVSDDDVAKAVAGLTALQRALQ